MLPFIIMVQTQFVCCNSFSQGIHKSSHLYTHSLVIMKYLVMFMPKNEAEMCSAEHAANRYWKPPKLMESSPTQITIFDLAIYLTVTSLLTPFPRSSEDSVRHRWT
jgi:hypothetical protein